MNNSDSRFPQKERKILAAVECSLPNRLTCATAYNRSPGSNFLSTEERKLSSAAWCFLFPSLTSDWEKGRGQRKRKNKMSIFIFLRHFCSFFFCPEISVEEEPPAQRIHLFVGGWSSSSGLRSHQEKGNMCGERILRQAQCFHLLGSDLLRSRKEIECAISFPLSASQWSLPHGPCF